MAEKEISRFQVAYKQIVKDPEFNYRKSIPNPLPPEVIAFVQERLAAHRALKKQDPVAASSTPLMDFDAADRMLGQTKVALNPAERVAVYRLLQLTADIHRQGLTNPVTVRESGAGAEGNRTYFLVAGERRYLACGLLGLTQIQINVKKGNTFDLKLLRLTENMQRDTPDAYEEAAAIDAMMKEKGWNQVRMAAELSCSPAMISQRLLLLSGSTPELKAAVEEGRIKTTSAREMASLPAPVQKKVLDEVVAKQDAKQKVTTAQVKETVAIEKAKLKRDEETSAKAKPKFVAGGYDDDEDDEDDEDTAPRSTKPKAAPTPTPAKVPEDPMAKYRRALGNPSFVSKPREDIIEALLLLKQQHTKATKDGDKDDLVRKLTSRIIALEWVLGVPNRKL
jgi:ParB/RepB/Spo0J family partition protein